MKTQDLLAELQLIAKLLDKSKKQHEGGDYEAHAVAKNARLVLEKVIQKIAAVKA